MYYPQPEYNLTPSQCSISTEGKKLTIYPLQNNSFDTKEAKKILADILLSVFYPNEHKLDKTSQQHLNKAFKENDVQNWTLRLNTNKENTKKSQEVKHARIRASEKLKKFLKKLSLTVCQILIFLIIFFIYRR